DTPRPLIKTLSAGDGFLSQSSSWLHFGLGDAKGIRHVVVRWPGGERRQYENLEIDQRYVVDQQSGQVTPWTAPEGRKSLAASHQAPLDSGGVARTVLPARRLLPTLQADGIDEPLNSQITRPTVISIWSATCSSCIHELQEYASHADRIRNAGLDVIAINLDNLEGGDSQSAKRVLADIDFPFTTAFGTVELVRSLDVLKRAIFDRWQTLSVPTSFLVDETGFVSVVYQGPVSTDQLLSDLEILKVPPDQLRRFSSPFPGRWIMPPPTADPLQVTSRFIDEAMVSNGIDYLERHAQIIEESKSDSKSQEPGDLYYVLAVLLQDQEQIDESLAAFRQAIHYRPNDFRFRNDFASLLAKMGQLEEAAEQLVQGSRINPTDVSVQRKLAYIRMKQGNLPAAIQRFNNVVQEQPKDVACWYNLANAYRANGELQDAVMAYRQTLKVQPKMLLAANNLAWILATHPQAEMRDGAEAVTLAKGACAQTNHAQPSFLDTLACAYAETGDFEKAAVTAERAIQIYTKMENPDKAAGIQSRLELFREKQPFRNEPK
ncbi:tetratricopeptide repeat protein, partial [Planctomycetota bacterium]